MRGGRIEGFCSIFIIFTLHVSQVAHFQARSSHLSERGIRGIKPRFLGATREPRCCCVLAFCAIFIIFHGWCSAGSCAFKESSSVSRGPRGIRGLPRRILPFKLGFGTHLRLPGTGRPFFRVHHIFVCVFSRTMLNIGEASVFERI